MVFTLVHPLVHVQVALGSAALTAQTTDVGLGVGRPDVRLQRQSIKLKGAKKLHWRLKVTALFTCTANISQFCAV